MYHLRNEWLRSTVSMHSVDGRTPRHTNNVGDIPDNFHNIINGVAEEPHGELCTSRVQRE